MAGFLITPTERLAERSEVSRAVTLCSSNRFAYPEQLAPDNGWVVVYGKNRANEARKNQLRVYYAFCPTWGDQLHKNYRPNVALPEPELPANKAGRPHGCNDEVDFNSANSHRNSQRLLPLVILELA